MQLAEAEKQNKLRMFPPRENRCRRFQANIFNKRKCQNCFRTVDSHTLSESYLQATKPVKAGWLLLAPEGVDLLNPAHKNRKWQRRYFILYEHGLLCYALDAMPGTLPQGSVNLKQCHSVLDASSQTSFCNSLRLCFSDRDYYIRTEKAENITGWQENLLVHTNAAKTNQKKRQREQMLSLHYPKKHAIPERNQVSKGGNSNCILNTSCSSRNTTKKRSHADRIGSVYSMSTSINIEDLNTRIGAEGISVGRHCSKETSDSYMEGEGVGSSPPASPGAGLQKDPVKLNEKGGVQSSSRTSHANSPNTSSFISSYFCSTPGQLPVHFSTNAVRSGEGIESGYSSLEKTRSDEERHKDPDQDYRRTQVISQFELENGGHMPARELCSSSSTSTCCAAEFDEDEGTGQSTAWTLAQGYDAPDGSAPTCRRSKSLERNLAEHTPTPDLLNFKKGWMTRLGEDGKWTKHWFVLCNQSLKFYRDLVAEENADLDGEINLSTCYDITYFPVQRNYGFQIHWQHQSERKHQKDDEEKEESKTKWEESMFAGAKTKDGDFALCAMTSGIRQNWIRAVMRNIQTSVAPDITSFLPQKVPMDMVSEYSCSEKGKRRGAAGRRREGRYKTFDWAEFAHMRKKRETLESAIACSDFVPPAPASSPEEPLSDSSTVVHTEMGQTPHFTKPADSSPLTVRSSIIASEPSDQKSADVDRVDAFNYVRNAQMEEKKETNLHTSPLPATFSSLSVQTECQWELELQTLKRELKTLYERSEMERRDYKLSEAHLQMELNGTLDSLCETKSKLQKTEATLKERENALEELRSRLEEVSGHLQATEEAHAMKDVRLQRRLCLLEESQERERRSLTDRLEHAEKCRKELEEKLMQTEAMLQKIPTGGIVEQFERKCQELQNQLDESDSELSRLQARLQHEETLYYDMEHNYEQVCEELEFVRGTLQNCERVCEERFRVQLEQQQEKLNRKERELQEVFRKIGCSSAALEMTRHHLQETQSTGEKVRNVGFGYMEKQPVAQRDESKHVISVMQALESKLCDSEERLQEITVHLQQQQQKLGNKVNALKVDQWNVQLPGQSLGQEGMSPEKHLSQEMTGRMLSLEALVIQRMASALEHPSRHLSEGLLELQSQMNAFGEAYDGRQEGPVTNNYSQLFSYYQEMGEAGCSLDEREIYSMCLKAELAYLTYTNHLHNLEEEHGSQVINAPFYLESEVTPLDPKAETSFKTDFWLSNVRLPELVLCKEQMQAENVGCYAGDMVKDHLVVELQTQARSLQALSKHLHPLDEDGSGHSELSPVLLRTVLFQAILTYVTSRLHVALQRQVHLLKSQQEQAVSQYRTLDGMVKEQAERYEEKLRENHVVIEVTKLARVSAETDAQIKGQEMQQLKAEFEKKLQELQRIHEKEMTRLSGYYTQNRSQAVSLAESGNDDHKLAVTSMKERISELELHIRHLEDEIREGDANTLRQTYEKELETLKVTCELGFSSMEQSHQRVIEEMQRQHQIEVEQLLEEKERVLQEETNATIAAIEVMRKAHKEELEKSKKTEENGASTDINQLRAQFKEKLDSLQRELEVLSEQYSQKCLENVHLSRAIETEKQALSSVERDNQELQTRNQELNKHLVSELSLMQSCVNGGVDQAQLAQGKDVIQLKVALKVKESEIQCLKQEISSLKEELQAANRHCKKALNELSVSGVKCQTACVKRSAETFRQRSQSYDVTKSRSNPDFLKNCTRPKQPVRSKSLKDRLSIQERMKLFESGSK